ncbi:MAG TPA: hypothetical protein VN026_08475 [Bacteroidia bacterium]|jgi:hypothetical protein|nr:hypothetical protein [Bacteroidia bacterium]
MKTLGYYQQFFLSFFISCLILIISCSKKDTKMNGSLTANNEVQIMGRFVKVKNFSESKSSKPHNQSTARDIDKDLTVSEVNADVEQSDLINLLANLKSQFQGDLNNLNDVPQIIAIHSQPSLNNIESNNVVGISVIIGNQDARLHHFYLISNNVATEIQQWNQKLIKLFKFNLLYLTNKYGTQNTGILILTSTTQNFEYSKLAPVNSFNTAVINDINSPVLRQDNTCGGTSKCHEEGKDCGYTPENFWSCNLVVVGNPNEDPFCPARLMAGVISTNSLNLQPLDISGINFIKDSILGKYTYGQKYIGYYNLIGAMVYYFDQFNLFNVKPSYNFIVATQNVLQKFKDPNSLEIPITPEYQKFALQMSAQYRVLTTNTFCNSALDTFEADINRFAGKTVKEILNEIQ